MSLSKQEVDHAGKTVLVDSAVDRDPKFTVFACEREPPTIAAACESNLGRIGGPFKLAEYSAKPVIGRPDYQFGAYRVASVLHDSDV